MNRVERRVRDLINPYSTAFASWWCHSARRRRPSCWAGARLPTGWGCWRVSAADSASGAPGRS